MFKLIFAIFLSLTGFTVVGQKYKPVDEGSKVHFVIKNFGINTGGELSGIIKMIWFSTATIVLKNNKIVAGLYIFN